MIKFKMYAPLVPTLENAPSKTGGPSGDRRGNNPPAKK